ncbi:MAG: aldo/keto reductase [Flavitalea sp.]
MKYRRLGTSPLQVSEISFGCMSLSGIEEDNAKLLHQAIDYGINFFDTADLYNKGMNEVSIGKALKGKRNEIILATKVGNQWREDGNGWDWNPRKEYILNAVNESLKRLQIDVIDLYQLHGGTMEDPIDETIEAFELLKQQGKIRFYGISSIRPNVIREYIKRSSIISVMMQYSLLDRRPEECCLDLLLENNIGVLVRGSLAQGLLVDKPSREYLGLSADEVAEANKAAKKLSGPARTPTQTALRYVLNHPAVTSAVVGIRTAEQLAEAVATAETPQLSNQEKAELSESVRDGRYEQHR